MFTYTLRFHEPASAPHEALNIAENVRAWHFAEVSCVARGRGVLVLTTSAELHPLHRDVLARRYGLTIDVD